MPAKQDKEHLDKSCMVKNKQLIPFYVVLNYSSLKKEVRCEFQTWTADFEAFQLGTIISKYQCMMLLPIKAVSKSSNLKF